MLHDLAMVRIRVKSQLALLERIPERSSHNILPMKGLAGKITSSLHEYNFACYNCINAITIALQMNTILRLVTV